MLHDGAGKVTLTSGRGCVQHRNFLAELELFRLKPSNDSETFRELVAFLSHVAPCFPKVTPAGRTYTPALPVPPRRCRRRRVAHANVSM